MEDVKKDGQEVVVEARPEGFFDDLPRSRFDLYDDVRAFPYVHVTTVNSLALVRKENVSVLFLYGYPMAVFHHGEGNVVEKVSYKVSNDLVDDVRSGGEVIPLAGFHVGIVPREDRTFVAFLPFEASKVSPLRALFAQRPPEVAEYLNFRSDFLKSVYRGEAVDVQEQVQKQLELLLNVIEKNRLSLAKAIINAITAQVISEEDQFTILKRGINRPYKPYAPNEVLIISVWENAEGGKYPVYPRTPVSRAISDIVSFYLGKSEVLDLHGQFQHLIGGEQEEFYKGEASRYVKERSALKKLLKESGINIDLDGLSNVAKFSLLYAVMFAEAVNARLTSPAPSQQQKQEGGFEEENFGTVDFDFNEALRKMSLTNLNDGIEL